MREYLQMLLVEERSLKARSYMLKRGGDVFTTG